MSRSHHAPAKRSSVHRCVLRRTEQAVATSKRSLPDSLRGAPARLLTERQFQVTFHEAPLGPHVDPPTETLLAIASSLTGVGGQQDLRALRLWVYSFHPDARMFMAGPPLAGVVMNRATGIPTGFHASRGQYASRSYTPITLVNGRAAGAGRYPTVLSADPAHKSIESATDPRAFRRRSHAGAGVAKRHRAARRVCSSYFARAGSPAPAGQIHCIRRATYLVEGETSGTQPCGTPHAESRGDARHYDKGRCARSPGCQDGKQCRCRFFRRMISSTSKAKLAARRSRHPLNNQHLNSFSGPS